MYHLHQSQSLITGLRHCANVYFDSDIPLYTYTHLFILIRYNMLNTNSSYDVNRINLCLINFFFYRRFRRVSVNNHNGMLILPDAGIAGFIYLRLYVFCEF